MNCIRIKSTVLLYLIVLLTFNSCKNENKKSNLRLNKTEQYQLDIIGKDNFKISLIQDRIAHQKNEQWKIVVSHRKNKTIKVIGKTALYRALNKIISNDYIAPKNAKYSYQNSKFEGIEAIEGNKLDTLKFSIALDKVISKNKEELNLLNTNCYIKPNFYLKDQATIDALKLIYKIMKVEVSYNFDNQIVKIPSTLFAKWIKTDDQMKVKIDASLSYNFLVKLAKEHDKIIPSIHFISKEGNPVSLSNSELGDRIDIFYENKILTNNLLTLKDEERKPKYIIKNISLSALTSNRNYVEIDLKKQVLYLFKNDSLIFQSDLVSGNESAGMSTTKGAFFVKYKETNACLEGPGYKTYVTYWMPFINGIGMHDASWRKSFGKEIYKTSGSHGCINLPRTSAQYLFQNVSPGTIVLCH